jgi:hypothetical protein
LYQNRKIPHRRPMETFIGTAACLRLPISVKFTVTSGAFQKMSKYARPIGVTFGDRP